MAIEPSPPPPPPPPSGGDGPGQKSYTIGGRTLSLGALVSLISAAVLLISVFFNWYTATVSISNVPGLSGFGGSRSASASGWDATDIAKLVFLLALVAGAALVVALFVPTVNLPWPAWMVSGACGGLAVLLVLYRIVSKPGQSDINKINVPGLHASIGTSFGIWLSLIAAIALTVGAYLLMNEPDETT